MDTIIMGRAYKLDVVQGAYMVNGIRAGYFTDPHDATMIVARDAGVRAIVAAVNCAWRAELRGQHVLPIVRQCPAPDDLVRRE